MNSSRKIDISKSSLVSLRAELARKQDEVLRAKAESQAQFIRPIPKVKKETIFTKKNSGTESRAEKDYEELKEEEDVLKKSRAALESKSKLYDELSRNSEQLDEEDSSRYLVNFQEKEWTSQNEPSAVNTFTPMPIANLVSSDNEGVVSDDDAVSDPEEDWVDYVDCLGRTRRCLRRDLPSMKARDSSLAGTLGHDEEPTPEPAVMQVYDVAAEADREMLSEDMRREMLRAKWEQQEKELQDRSDVHYQDVLFDEARSHGVGYYGFSGDEAARAAQQAALAQLRADTQRQQEATRAARERRQKQLDARLKAARQRQRIKMGLPPEQDEPEPEPVAEVAPEVAPPVETAQPKARKDHVRPWDVGKEGLSDTPVMSQEEWTAKRRKERDTEFAPPTEYNTSRSPPPRKPRFKERPLPSMDHPPTSLPSFDRPPPSYLPPLDRPPPSYPPPLDRPPPSYPPPKRPKPAKQSANISDAPSSNAPVRKGAEIAPPPTFEYYGPSGSKSNSKPASSAEELEKSIMAGLKFLRQQAERKENSKEKGLLDIV